MSNTHKIHSQASADAAPSIIHPAGGFTALPRLEGCLAWQWGWQGQKRLHKGRRPWGFHTCPEAAGAPAGMGPVPCAQPCQARPGWLQGYPGQGGKDLVHLCSVKVGSLEPPQRPAQAQELIIAPHMVFPSISSLAPHPAYQVGPFFKV